MTENRDEGAKPDGQEEIRVAEVMQQIRAGIRQRQAELATVGGRVLSGEEEHLAQQLRELQAKAHIREQPFTSDKPIIGRLIVFIRETWNSVSTKWYVRPMLRQQNIFNQAMTQMVHELHKRLEELDQLVIGSDRDVTLLARKVAEGEYQMRQWKRQATEERIVLARRLTELEKALAILDDHDADK